MNKNIYLKKKKPFVISLIPKFGYDATAQYSF